jgi:hypothetical protein|tara:strand:+ start:627 stop:1772 length:1146 start_codon:yes stop_codon:yes gene_type:complete
MYDVNSLSGLISRKKCTILGIGPMSKNCVDVTINLANRYNTPLMLIASRRQIETKELGGGYVNNWTTEEFIKYVHEKDVKKNIILCRDHGGPFQGNNEKEQKLTLVEAMKNAKVSFLADIKAGFKILHIDPSENLQKEIDIDKMLERIYELYDFCCTAAKENKKQVFFEISIGKEDGEVHRFEEINYAISKIENFCLQRNLPKPTFIVTKTGNYVMETKNIGVFEEIIKGNRVDDKENIKQIIELCNKKNIMIKEHNADYLSDEALKTHPEMGIHAINVAPEFGVTETKAILTWLSKNNLEEQKKLFLDIAFKSNKWEKWMIPNSNATQNDKSVISGHYVFSNNQFKTIIHDIKNQKKFNIYLNKEIEKVILRYMINLKLI